MSLKNLTLSFPWTRYSRKLIQKILYPRSTGKLTQEEAQARGLRWVMGEEGTLEGGNVVRFYWWVDKEDGVLVDAKFQVFGQSALIGAADIACDVIVGKNYDQARRLSTELIESQARDKDQEPAFPPETFPYLNLVMGAIDTAAEQCTDLPLPQAYVAMPAPRDFGEVIEGGVPGYLEMPLKQKLALIEEVLDRDIRPYIALDAGGVEVINLLNNTEIVITYQGSCTSCYSSIGTTLTYIQQVLRAKVHPAITVVPDIDIASLR